MSCDSLRQVPWTAMDMRSPCYSCCCSCPYCYLRCQATRSFRILAVVAITNDHCWHRCFSSAPVLISLVVGSRRVHRMIDVVLVVRRRSFFGSLESSSFSEGVLDSDLFSNRWRRPKGSGKSRRLPTRPAARCMVHCEPCQ